MDDCSCKVAKLLNVIVKIAFEVQTSMFASTFAILSAAWPSGLRCRFYGDQNREVAVSIRTLVPL